MPSCVPNSGSFFGPKIKRAKISITVTSGKPTPKIFIAVNYLTNKKSIIKYSQIMRKFHSWKVIINIKKFLKIVLLLILL